MTVLQKGVLPLGVAAAVLMLSGCHSAASQTTSPAGTTPPPTSGATATTDADSSGGQVDACALLTPQELTPILGAGVDAGSDTSSDTTAACAYTGSGVVTVVVDPADGKSKFDMDCSTDQPQPNIQPVNGLADGACLTIVGGAIGAVYILKGTDVMSLNIQAGSEAALTPDSLIALGTSAAGRL
jgi:Protein of unknown function (DUF3558)